MNTACLTFPKAKGIVVSGDIHGDISLCVRRTTEGSRASSRSEPNLSTNASEHRSGAFILC